MAGIRLEFAQFGDFDSFDILRSTSPMDIAALPSPIVAGLATMYYVDTAVVEGATYYYRARVWRGIESQVSNEINVLVSAATGDAYWSNVTSLLHFDEAAAPSDIKDEKGLIWSLVNGAALSSLDSKFGSAKSMYTTSAASGYAISEQTNAFDFNSDDKFTLEFFYKKMNNVGNATPVAIVSDSLGTTVRWAFFIRYGENPNCAVYDGDSTFLDASIGIANFKWTHFAYTKDGNTNKLFIDGILAQTTTKATKGYPLSKIIIGKEQATTGVTFTGYVDELRITKGVARYTANFTPPDAPFPSS